MVPVFGLLIAGLRAMNTGRRHFAYTGDERVGATVRRAYEDALRWVSEQ